MMMMIDVEHVPQEPAPRHRHARNVVSAMGHFASFAVSMAHLLLIPTIHLVSDAKSAPIAEAMMKFITFLFPSINFVIYPFIETMFSQNLRRNFFKLTSWKSILF